MQRSARVRVVWLLAAPRPPFSRATTTAGRRVMANLPQAAQL